MCANPTVIGIRRNLLKPTHFSYNRPLHAALSTYCTKFAFPESKYCRSGGTGRRARFRGVCQQWRAGSTPAFGTTTQAAALVDQRCCLFSLLVTSIVGSVTMILGGPASNDPLTVNTCLSMSGFHRQPLPHSPTLIWHVNLAYVVITIEYICPAINYEKALFTVMYQLYWHLCNAPSPARMY